MVLWKVSSLFLRKPGFLQHRAKSSIKQIDKLLIANRGEIACRIIKTTKRLGIRTVAVYSEADKNALHVALADESYQIGPPAPSQSYLRQDKILEIAQKTACQAIHPGYGFLSENVEFAESCTNNNLIFVGPPSSAIRDMGIKSTSKLIMSKAGVPIIPGYHGEDQSNVSLQKEAEKIGFPIMIKAVRGGGGKGMRIARSSSDFIESLESARTEALKSFGDSVVLLEKFVGEPRHVEVQIFGDLYGNVVHLYERDCSVQRRHQKIIEEAPAPGISKELQKELGEAACRAAKAVGYVGAGTVEFILDKNTLSYYFMEMNTRLQVEHPITEMITKTDLVEWQLRVAAGDPLPFSQKDIPLQGHAFEARIYAEDPRGGFLPGAGNLTFLETPCPGEDVRIETGVRQGDEVSVYYDPMIAKLVVWGKNRQEALKKLNFNLQNFTVAGLETNVNFLLDLTKHPEFMKGNVHTNFIKDHYKTLFKEEQIKDLHLVQAALSMVLQQDNLNSKDPFYVESSFRVNHDLIKTIKLKHKEQVFKVQIKFFGSNDFSMSIDGAGWVDVSGKLIGNALNCSVGGAKSLVKVFGDDQSIAVFHENGKTQFELEPASYLGLLQEEDEAGPSGQGNRVVAPMPGILDKILVESGDVVHKGDSLFVLIAMKMEHIVKAQKDATILSISKSTGSSVLKDETIIQFKE